MEQDRSNTHTWQKRAVMSAVMVAGVTALFAGNAQAAACSGGYSGNYCIDGSTMSPNDASFLDRKLDDGVPKSGLVVSILNNTATLPGTFHHIPGCDVGTGESYQTSGSLGYKQACALSFRTAF